MHSYVYQISEKPLSEKEWITREYLMEHPDFLPVADGMDDVTDRGRPVELLASCLEHGQLGTMFDDSFVLAPDAAESYFAGRFAAFQQAAAALQKLNENQFLHEHRLVQNLICDLGRAFTNRYGGYVLLDKREDAVSLDEFIRSAKPGVCYFIGGILDYCCGGA